jgi:hypothetical protein
MRKHVLFAFLAVYVTLLFLGSASAQVIARTDVPPIVLSGMEAYKPGNPEQAIKAWTKNSPLEGTQVVVDETANLHQAQNLYGAFHWFDVISNREISKRVRIIYLTMNYEAGPLFARFVLYSTDRGWIITAFDFNPDDTKILPLAVE